MFTLLDDSKKEVADLSGRMLVEEEDVKKISSFIFSRDGKSIVMNNKSRLSGLKTAEQNAQSEYLVLEKGDE